MPDQTKLAITDCASRRSAMPTSFGAVGHCRLLLVLSLLFRDPFSLSHWMSVCFYKPSITLRFSDAYSLKRSRVGAQLNTGSRRLSKGGTERYGGLRCSLNAEQFR